MITGKPTCEHLSQTGSAANHRVAHLTSRLTELHEQRGWDVHVTGAEPFAKAFGLPIKTG
jgi:hypothetical protein